MQIYNLRGSFSQFDESKITVFEIVAGEDWGFRRSNLRRLRIPKIQAPESVMKFSTEIVTNFWETIKEGIPKNYELHMRFCRFSYRSSTFYPFLTNDFYLHAVHDSAWHKSVKETEDIADYLKLTTLPVNFRGVYHQDYDALLVRYPSRFRPTLPYGLLARLSTQVRIAEIGQMGVSLCYYPSISYINQETSFSLKDFKQNGFITRKTD